MQPAADTAILVFSRTAAQEAACKKFVGNKRQDFFIATQLIAATLKTANATGLPVISNFSPQQKGKNFGERFANAIEAVCAMGFSKVIAIGTDSPDVSCKNIQEVAELLNHQNMVAGASTDGGVYILGVNKDSYNRGEFLEIPWQTHKVGAALAALNDCAPEAFCSFLPKLQDIDNAYDFYKWISASNHFNPLRICFYALFVKSGFQQKEQVFIPPFFFQEINRRGPPARLAA